MASCQKQEFIDTGIANGKVDGSILDYLQTNSYNWDSTYLVVKRAGLEDLFSGDDPAHEQITFLAPTNHSILKWMLKNNYKAVNEIPVETCKSLILRHVIQDKFMLKDVPVGNTWPKEGGMTVKALGNNDVFLCNYVTSFDYVPDAGPRQLRIYSPEKYKVIYVASTDIDCDNGVVHSLHYAYYFSDL